MKHLHIDTESAPGSASEESSGRVEQHLQSLTYRTLESLMDNGSQLLFLDSKKFDAGKAIRGAFLLTDMTTKPIEFRCTSPIRPTALQGVLYGKTLQRHIAVELIGVPLASSIKTSPAVALVQDPDLLWLRTKVDFPVVHVGREADVPSGGSQPMMLNSRSGNFEPLVATFHSEYSEDADKVQETLLAVFSAYDLIEPFGRISTALDQVHQQKVAEQQ